MRNTLFLLLSLSLLACGSERIQRPKPPTTAAQERYERAVTDFEAGRLLLADERLRALLREQPSSLRPYIQLYLARMNIKARPALALRQLSALAELKAPEELRNSAHFYAGLTAQTLERCPEVQHHLQPLLPDLENPLAQQAEDALKRCGLIQEPSPEGSEELDHAVPAQLKIGVILPLSGRSRRLGQDLRRSAQLLLGKELEIHDGASSEKVERAMQALAEGGTFGVVGLFAKESAAAAAQAAESLELPLLMLSLDPAAVEGAGPTWRSLHTSALSCSTLAGGGLERGGRRAAILAPENPFAKNQARLFRAAWEGGGAQISAELSWDPESPNWKRLSEILRRSKSDTLFLPCQPSCAAQVMSHLAAQGIWSRGPKLRYRGDRSVRELILLGLGEWYNPQLLRQAGRYLEGALIPLPFAAETARGASFAQKIRKEAGHRATPFDALLADSITALSRAHRRALKEEISPRQALSKTQVQDGVSSGLNFKRREAVEGLFLMEISKGAFLPMR